jgi:hypothetical protein
MAGKNPWMTHLASVWKTLKSKGGSYRDAMVAAKKTYRKGGASADAAPKKRRRKKKRSSK